MIGLKVQINDEAPVLAASSDLGALSAILNCTGPLGPDSQPVREHEELEIFFTLGGLTSRGPEAADEHPRWLDRDGLRVGDRVSIEVVQVDQAAPMQSSSPARDAERDEREYFEHCRRVFLELREKYEGVTP